MFSWVEKKQRNQRSNCEHPLDHRKTKRIPKKICFCFTSYAKNFECVDHNKLWKILKEMGLPDHLSCECCFQASFLLSSFTFTKRLFSSSLSAIRVVSSAYMRLLIFLLAILIQVCASSSPAFLMMYSA